MSWGITQQVITDVSSGKDSGWEAYVGAAMGGAVAGEIMLYARNSSLATGLGNLTSSSVTQLLRMASGKQESFDFVEATVKSLEGFAVGAIPGPKIKGITAGRGSYMAISKQIVTKFERNIISGFKSMTAFKMYVANSLSWAFPSAIVGGVVDGVRE